MEYELIIPGELGSMNEMIGASRTNRYAGNKWKREQMDLVIFQIKKQLKGVQIRQPVNVHFMWVRKTRRGDPDNISGAGRKVILDALVQCGVIKNDTFRWIHGLTDQFAFDNEHPRTEVLIEVLNE